MRLAVTLAVLLVVILLAAGVAAVVASLADGGQPKLVVTLPLESAPGAARRPQAAESDDRPLTAEEARRAGAAALRVTGVGRVSELDRSDDPGEAYEVEVIATGREHDVALDADFRPVPNRRYDD